MISKERYDYLCEHLLTCGVPEKELFSIDIIEKYLQEMFDINKNKSEFFECESESLTISYLFALRWGILSLGIPEEKMNPTTMAVRSFFVAISNTTFAIIKLALDGMDYQASILTRSLYELCMTMLAIIIEPDKRTALIKGAEPKDSYNIWNQHFRFKNLDRIITKYEKKVSKIDFEYELYSWRKDNYSEFSTYVHNNYLPLLLSGYAQPKIGDGEMLKFNLWGNFASRVNIITENINTILWYTELLFERLLSDENIDMNPTWYYKDDESKEMWKLTMFIGILTKEYYMKFRLEEEKS